MHIPMTQARISRPAVRHFVMLVCQRMYDRQVYSKSVPDMLSPSKHTLKWTVSPLHSPVTVIQIWDHDIEFKIHSCILAWSPLPLNEKNLKRGH